MYFQNAQAVEQFTWEMKFADWPRAIARRKINDLFDGNPPYTAEDEERNNIEINVNDLTATRLAHDARSQMANGIQKPGNFFTARTDSGALHKRLERGTIFTREINKLMKRSDTYYEKDRSQFAMTVLHAIGPTGWDDPERWCPWSYGIDDVMIPSGTLLAMNNLEAFAVFRSYTAAELIKLTAGPNVDPAWNLPMVQNILEWADKQARMYTQNATFNELWSPEKVGQRIKEHAGLYYLDAVPRIDTWDFYFWNDRNKHAGWNRRMILDADWAANTGGERPPMPDKTASGYRGFLYDPGKRKYADKREELICFQFGDLSAVAPFRYHTARGLGYMLFAICHLQNRLRCKFNEAVFEGLMPLLRVKSLDEAERALKVMWVTRGIIDETVQFVPPSERWQPNEQLAALGLSQNDRLISDNSSSWMQNQQLSGNPGVEKTKFQVQAEVNATMTLVSTALQQAYRYRATEYREIKRRFLIKNSRDADVREFRLNCLKQGIPERMLVPEAWEVEPEQVFGAGNKTVEMQVANWLMERRNLFDPEPQRIILRQATLAATDNAGLTNMLVPEQPAKVTDAVHDAQLAVGTLMLGVPVGLKTGINHIEYVETLLGSMALIIQRITKRDNMGTEEELIGLQNMAGHIAQHIQIIAQDPNEKQRVKAYQDDLGQLMNLVKAFGQRLAEQRQQQNGHAQNGVDPETIGKIQAQQITAQAKAANMRESHAAKTAQRQVSFEQKTKQSAEQHQLEMEKQRQQVALDTQAKDLETAAAIQRANAEAANAPKTTTE